MDFSPNITRKIKSRRVKMAGHVAHIREMFALKPEGKRLICRPRRRWGNNIKIDLREIAWEDVDWIDLAQDRDQ
jgi:hypothetical protein